MEEGCESMDLKRVARLEIWSGGGKWRRAARLQIYGGGERMEEGYGFERRRGGKWGKSPSHYQFGPKISIPAKHRVAGVSKYVRAIRNKICTYKIQNIQNY